MGIGLFAVSSYHFHSNTKRYRHKQNFKGSRRQKACFAFKAKAGQTDWLEGSLHWHDDRVAWEIGDGEKEKKQFFIPTRLDLAKTERRLTQISYLLVSSSREKHRNKATKTTTIITAAADRISPEWLERRFRLLTEAKELQPLTATNLPVLVKEVTRAAARPSSSSSASLKQLLGLLAIEALCVENNNSNSSCVQAATPSKALLLSGESAMPPLLEMVLSKEADTAPKAGRVLAAIVLGTLLAQHCDKANGGERPTITIALPPSTTPTPLNATVGFEAIRGLNDPQMLLAYEWGLNFGMPNTKETPFLVALLLTTPAVKAKAKEVDYEDEEGEGYPYLLRSNLTRVHNALEIQAKDGPFKLPEDWLRTRVKEGSLNSLKFVELVELLASEGGTLAKRVLSCRDVAKLSTESDDAADYNSGAGGSGQSNKKRRRRRRRKNIISSIEGKEATATTTTAKAATDTNEAEQLYPQRLNWHQLLILQQKLKRERQAFLADLSLRLLNYLEPLPTAQTAANFFKFVLSMLNLNAGGGGKPLDTDLARAILQTLDSGLLLKGELRCSFLKLLVDDHTFLWSKSVRPPRSAKQPHDGGKQSIDANWFDNRYQQKILPARDLLATCKDPAIVHQALAIGLHLQYLLRLNKRDLDYYRYCLGILSKVPPKSVNQLASCIIPALNCYPSVHEAKRHFQPFLEDLQLKDKEGDATSFYLLAPILEGLNLTNNRSLREALPRLAPYVPLMACFVKKFPDRAWIVRDIADGIILMDKQLNSDEAEAVINNNNNNNKPITTTTAAATTTTTKITVAAAQKWVEGTFSLIEELLSDLNKAKNFQSYQLSLGVRLAFELSGGKFTTYRTILTLMLQQDLDTRTDWVVEGLKALLPYPRLKSSLGVAFSQQTKHCLWLVNLLGLATRLGFQVLQPLTELKLLEQVEVAPLLRELLVDNNNKELTYLINSKLLSVPVAMGSEYVFELEAKAPEEKQGAGHNNDNDNEDTDGAGYINSGSDDNNDVEEEEGSWKQKGKAADAAGKGGGNGEEKEKNNNKATLVLQALGLYTKARELLQPPYLLRHSHHLPSGVKQALALPVKLASELEYLEQRVKMDPRPELLKRISSLKARLTSNSSSLSGVSTDLQEEVLAEVLKRLELATAQAHLSLFEQQLNECYRTRLQMLVAALPSDLEMNNNILNAVLLFSNINQNRRLLLRLLRVYLRDETHQKEFTVEWLQNLKANQNFLQELVDRSSSKKVSVVTEWLGEHLRTYNCAKILGDKVILRLERDPLHVLQMGNYFDTCLSFSGCNAFSTVTNACELNKRVIFASDAKGRIIGRKLIGINAEWELVGYHTYTSLHDKAANEELHKIFGEYCREFAKLCGLSLGEEGTVPKLFAEDWYDDGIESWGSNNDNSSISNNNNGEAA